MLKPSEIKQWCEKNRFKPSKKRGQNFLIRETPLHKMIEALDLKNTDMVIEIGPGFGALTQELIPRAKKVIALEIEPLFINYIQNQYGSGVEVVPGDAVHTLGRVVLALPLHTPYRLAGNIPYQITGALIERALTLEYKPERICFMVQKEVGERILAKPPRMNFLSALTQYYAEPSIAARVSRGNFWPEPQVDSVIVRFDMRQPPPPASEGEKIKKLLEAGFQHPRKTLINNLLHAALANKQSLEKALTQAGISLRARPAELSINNWKTLAFKIYTS